MQHAARAKSPGWLAVGTWARQTRIDARTARRRKLKAVQVTDLE